MATATKKPKTLAKQKVVSDALWNAEACREELLKIAQEEGGNFGPQAVVERARDESNPLHYHPIWTWDVNEAAEKCWRVQAAFLIRTIRVTVVRQTAKARQVELKLTRGFVAPISERKSKNNPDGGYAPIQDVLDDPLRREGLIQTALAELSAFRKKYEALSELAALWSALDELSISR